ncbi:uncharacterized protein LOC132201350 [Neocloeon triangulifer]|uniref:uncharacterized protein LOC132201350 n=1 Tax=Neocloeon triangulifer TaxID=2078957 RepID=UPI00286F1DCD|nr:uncharacterized protein LOC132201350 [Neocloeon triangulifer]
MPFSSSSSDSKRGGFVPYPEDEPDDIVRYGEVFIIRRGVSSKTDKETPFHHWAIAIKFEAFWVVIEGDNDGHFLVPGYNKSTSTPSGTLISMKSEEVGPYTKGSPELILVITQYLKAASTVNLSFVKISPKQLHALAGSIPKKPYVLGINDCQTWFLDALDKLQHFEVGDKEFHNRVKDVGRSLVKAATVPVLKAAGTYTNAVHEVAQTIDRVCNGDEFAPSAIVDGVGKTTNCVINGASETFAGAVNGVADFGVNLIGLATGGCATNSGARSNGETLNREVAAGRMGPVEATVKCVGKGAGLVVYGAANVTINAVGGVAKTATTLVSGVSTTFSDTADLVAKVHRDCDNPVLAALATPGAAVVGVSVGVAKTAGNVAVEVGNTVVSIFDGIASIF